LGLEEADNGGTEEAAEIARTVDERDAGGSGAAAEQRRGQRPEHRHRGDDTGSSQHQAEHGERRIAPRPGAQKEPDRGGKTGKDGMPAAFARAVGVTAGEYQRDQRCGVRNGGEQADGECVPDAGLADDGRLPEADGVGAHLDAEEDSAEQPDPGTSEDRPNRPMGLRFGFGVNLGGNSGSFDWGEPPCLNDSVIEKEKDDDAEQDSGDRLQDEKPLPCGDALGVAEVMEDEAGERAADDAGDRVASH